VERGRAGKLTSSDAADNSVFAMDNDRGYGCGYIDSNNISGNRCRAMLKYRD
jgi:hypothetical protein